MLTLAKNIASNRAIFAQSAPTGPKPTMNNTRYAAANVLLCALGVIVFAYLGHLLTKKIKTAKLAHSPLAPPRLEPPTCRLGCWVQKADALPLALW